MKVQIKAIKKIWAKKKTNILFRNYSLNKDNSIHIQSKKNSRNNSKTKNLLLNKTNIKRSSSTSKTNYNSLNISKNFNKKLNVPEKEK